jgi:hypothetical protein
MAEYIKVDEQEYEQLVASNERLDNAIKQCKSYFTLDSIMDNTNTDCLQVLEFIKTGLKK